VNWISGGEDRQRFEAFVADVGDGLVRTAYLMTGDLSEAEDLAQETLLRCARNWKRVRSMEYPAAYGRRILVHLVIDGGGRRRRRNDELETGATDLDRYADDSAARVLRGIDALADFRLALAALPQRQRAVIVLRYWEDLSEAAVAELLHCSLGTVKSTASRGIARLRATLTDNDLFAAEATASTADDAGAAS
jgi:RNA polymerase sigma-70 factor (sigma-E family)